MWKKWRYLLVAGAAFIAAGLLYFSTYFQNLTEEGQAVHGVIFVIMLAVLWVGIEIGDAQARSELRAPQHKDPEEDDGLDDDPEEYQDSVDDEEVVADFKSTVERWLGKDEDMLQWLSDARHYMREDNRAADDDARDLALLMVVYAYAGGHEFPSEHYPAYLDEVRTFIEWLKARNVWPARR